MTNENPARSGLSFSGNRLSGATRTERVEQRVRARRLALTEGSIRPGFSYGEDAGLAKTCVQ
jgi:hypothetical protein